MMIENTSLYDATYKTEEKFVRAMCIEHAAANMGMEHLLDEHDVIEDVYQALAEAHYDAFLSESGYGFRNQARSEAMAFDAVDGEVKSWENQAKEDLQKIKERGLPQTLRSSRMVFAGGVTYHG